MKVLSSIITTPFCSYIISFAVLAVALLISSTASATPTTTTNPADNLSFIPVLASLVVVIVAIFIVAYLAKKFNLGMNGNRAIKVISALSLGTKERIIIIEVAGKQHVLGVTSQQVNHLFELEQPLEEGAVSHLSGDSNNQEPMTFQKLLAGFKNQKGQGG